MGVDYGNVPGGLVTTRDAIAKELAVLVGVTGEYQFSFNDCTELPAGSYTVGAVASGAANNGLVAGPTNYSPGVGVWALHSAAGSGSGCRLQTASSFVGGGAQKWGVAVRAAWPTVTDQTIAMLGFFDNTSGYLFGFGHLGGKTDGTYAIVYDHAGWPPWVLGTGSPGNGTTAIDGEFHTFYFYTRGDGTLRLRERGATVDMATAVPAHPMTAGECALAYFEYNCGTDAAARDLQIDFLATLSGS